MKSPEVVVAGHICLDVIPTFSESVSSTGSLFEPGTLIEVGRPVMATGGAVSNVGLALDRLGVPVGLIGKVGDDLFGRAILEILQNRSEALARGMIAAAGESSSYTVVLSPPGVDRIFLHSPGANETFRPDEVDLSLVDGARIFHFGYPPILKRTFADGGAALSRLFAQVRDRGALVSLDMAQYDAESSAGRADWPAFLKTVLPNVDLFGPSIGEILLMLGYADGTQADGRMLRDVADRLIGMGPSIVALKLGDDGLFLRTTPDRERLEAVPGVTLGAAWRGRTLLHGCFDVDAVGTTGAGDCTLAGLLTSLLRGRSPEEAVREAAAVGACSVEREDSTSGVPTWDEVQERLRRGWNRLDVGIELDDWTYSDEEAIWLGPEESV